MHKLRKLIMACSVSGCLLVATLFALTALSAASASECEDIIFLDRGGALTYDYEALVSGTQVIEISVFSCDENVTGVILALSGAGLTSGSKQPLASSDLFDIYPDSHQPIAVGEVVTFTVELKLEQQPNPGQFTGKVTATPRRGTSSAGT